MNTLSRTVADVRRRAADVRRRAKLQDHIAAKAAATIAAMHAGEALHLRHDRSGAVWWLSRSGVRVADEVAQLVIKNPTVADVGDALPLGVDVPAQTFRYVES